MFSRIIFLVWSQHTGALRWALASGAYTLVSCVFDHVYGLQVCVVLCCVSDLVCSSVSCVLLVWSGVVCSCVSSVVFPGVSYALMSWSACFTRLLVERAGGCAPRPVGARRHCPSVSGNLHLSAFGLVALHLFRVPTARPGRPRINLLRPARPFQVPLVCDAVPE